MITKTNKAHTIDTKYLECIQHMVETGVFKNESDGVNQLIGRGLDNFKLDNFVEKLLNKIL